MYFYIIFIDINKLDKLQLSFFEYIYIYILHTILNDTRFIPFLFDACHETSRSRTEGHTNEATLIPMHTFPHPWKRPWNKDLDDPKVNILRLLYNRR